MITKAPEIAVILSVFVIGLRLYGDRSHPLSYLLLGIWLIAGMWWIHSRYDKKEPTRKRIGRFRLELTWATASVLVTFAIFPQGFKPQAIQKSEQTVANPRVETTTPPPSPVVRQEARAIPSAPTIQPHLSEGSAGPETGLSVGHTLVNVPNPPPTGKTIEQTDSRANNIIGEDKSSVTLVYSQIGDIVTVKPSGRVDSTSLAFFFDADVSLTSHSLGPCTNCGNGRLKDSNNVPDNKTIWIFWASPPFIPDHPLSLTFSSATQAKLLRVTWGPRFPADDLKSHHH